MVGRTEGLWRFHCAFRDTMATIQSHLKRALRFWSLQCTRSGSSNRLVFSLEDYAWESRFNAEALNCIVLWHSYGLCGRYCEIFGPTLTVKFLIVNDLPTVLWACVLHGSVRWAVLNENTSSYWYLLHSQEINWLLKIYFLFSCACGQLEKHQTLTRLSTIKELEHLQSLCNHFSVEMANENQQRTNTELRNPSVCLNDYVSLQQLPVSPRGSGCLPPCQAWTLWTG
jgi:hypothetical protein